MSPTAVLPQVTFASGEALHKAFDELVSASGPNRTAGSPSGRKAFEWIMARARAIPGWTISEETFKPDVAFAIKGYEYDFLPFSKLDPASGVYRKSKRDFDELTGFAKSLGDKTLSNLILRKEGSDPSVANAPIVVSAHFDTITWRRAPFTVLADAPNPGADDNGAAVAALLAVAESLKALKPRRPVELVFTDACEAFHLGAYAHGMNLLKAGVHADVIVLETIGWDGVLKDEARVYRRGAGEPGSARDAAIASGVASAVQSVGLKVSVSTLITDRTETYGYFHSFHFGALLTENREYGFNDSHYHMSNDKAESIDWDYAAKIGKATAIVVASGAGASK